MGGHLLVHNDDFFPDLAGLDVSTILPMIWNLRQYMTCETGQQTLNTRSWRHESRLSACVASNGRGSLPFNSAALCLLGDCIRPGGLCEVSCRAALAASFGVCCVLCCAGISWECLVCPAACPCWPFDLQQFTLREWLKILVLSFPLQIENYSGKFNYVCSLNCHCYRGICWWRMKTTDDSYRFQFQATFGNILALVFQYL